MSLCLGNTLWGLLMHGVSDGGNSKVMNLKDMNGKLNG